MKSRQVSGLMLAVALLLLAGGAGPARGVPPSEPEGAMGASPGSVANAPWVKMELDTAQNTGHHLSVAIDPIYGGVYVSYYDAVAQDLSTLALAKAVLQRPLSWGPRRCPSE